MYDTTMHSVLLMIAYVAYDSLYLYTNWLHFCCRNY